jgi:hypothetical protein
MVIYDDPAYYPYRYGQGGDVVVSRPLRPASRYVFKEAQPGEQYVTHLRKGESDEERRESLNRDRTSADVGGPGAIPAPGVDAGEARAFRKRAEAELEPPQIFKAPAPQRPDTPAQPVRARKTRGKSDPPDGLHAADPARKVPAVQRGARNPQSTGEPELRRRKP